MEDKFFTYSHYDEINKFSYIFKEKFKDLNEFLHTFYSTFYRELFTSEESFSSDYRKENFKNFLNFFLRVISENEVLTLEILKKLGFSFSVKNSSFRDKNVKGFFGQEVCDASFVTTFLLNTLEWFSVGEGGVSMLHPVEKSVLFTLRLCDIMPFNRGNVLLIKWIPFFYLLKNNIIPPFNLDFNNWKKSLSFASKNFMTSSLTGMYKTLTSENCKKFYERAVKI